MGTKKKKKKRLNEPADHRKAFDYDSISSRTGTAAYEAPFRADENEQPKRRIKYDIHIQTKTIYYRIVDGRLMVLLLLLCCFCFLIIFFCFVLCFYFLLCLCERVQV
eukprot:PhF_6_TR6988/c2_g2_i2/m.10355